MHRFHLAVVLLVPGAAACGPPPEPIVPPVATATGSASAAVSAPAPPAPAIVVCSWNIKWFGQKATTEYRFDRLAAALARCDVVAIQELRGQRYADCMRELKSRLNASSNDVYRYRTSQPTGYEANTEPGKNDYTERHAYLWRSDRLELVGTPRFVASPAVNNPTYRQVPWVGHFKVLGGQGFDFELMSVHTVYNKSLNAVRAAEIAAIRDWVVGAAGREEKNAVALGDFNANPSGQPHHFAALFPVAQTDLRLLMYEPPAAGEEPIRTTVPTRDATPGTAYYRSPVYDHVLVSLATESALYAKPMRFSAGDIGVERFDDDPSWTAAENRAYRISHVSDHRPIWFKLRRDTPDED